MNFFPYNSYLIKTELPPEEVKQVLLKNIAPFKIARLFFVKDDLDDESYHGKICGDRFTIQRIISGRNSFLPIIEGQIFNTSGGAKIKIRMRLAIYTYIAWITITGFLLTGLIEVVQLMILRNKFSMGSLILLALLIVSYLFAVLSFHWEITKSKKYLERLFPTTQLSLVFQTNKAGSGKR